MNSEGCRPKCLAHEAKKLKGRKQPFFFLSACSSPLISMPLRKEINKIPTIILSISTKIV